MKKLILAFRIFIFLLVSFKITLAQNETSIYFYEEGKEINDIKKGKWVEYYESGSLLAKGKYVYGKKSGTWKEYFENGCVKAKGNYVDGKKQGKWTEYSIYAYSEDYSRIAKGNYIDGKKHGEWIEYYLAYEYYLNKTRTIRYPPVNINYVEGKKQGEVINFF
jgi:antitoxin component YwqK of YwqJK toxin-antitoxin module